MRYKKTSVVFLIFFLFSLSLLARAYAGQSEAFGVANLVVRSVDPAGNAAEDQRSFAVTLNQIADSFNFTLYESDLNALFLNIEMWGGISSFYVGPDLWGGKKLKPDTKYKYSIRATSQETGDELVFEDAFTTVSFNAENPLPDLVVSDITEYYGKARLVIKNEGGQFASQGFTTAVSDVNGKILKGSDARLVATAEQGKVVHSGAMSYAYFDIEPGDYELKAEIDTGNSVNESDENNNSKVRSIKIPASPSAEWIVITREHYSQIIKDHAGKEKGSRTVGCSEICAAGGMVALPFCTASGQSGLCEKTVSSGAVTATTSDCEEGGSGREVGAEYCCCAEDSSAVVENNDGTQINSGKNPGSDNDSKIQENAASAGDQFDGSKVKNAKMRRLSGRIMLKVEDGGKAYYADPAEGRIYFLGKPHNAFEVMRKQGIGIRNRDLAKIPAAITLPTGKDQDSDGIPDALEDALGTQKAKPDSDGDGYQDKMEIMNGYDPARTGRLGCDSAFTKKQAGKIFLQVEKQGEAWYANPADGKRYFLGRPADAFAIMRKLGIGISNKDFKAMLE